MAQLGANYVRSNAAGFNDVVSFQNSSGTQNGTLCRAWVNFNGTGVVAIRANFNVSSITDNGTGDYTVNFTNAMADSNYSISGTSSSVVDITNVGSNAVGSSSVTGLFPRGTTTRLVGSVRVWTAFFDHSIDCAKIVDCESVSAAIFR